MFTLYLRYLGIPADDDAFDVVETENGKSSVLDAIKSEE